jgi:hypothetical protein
VSNPKLKDLKIGRIGLKPKLGEPSNKFKIPKLRSSVNLLKRKELHNTGLKQQEFKKEMKNLATLVQTNKSLK